MPKHVLSESDRARILAGAISIEVPGTLPASATASPATPQVPAAEVTSAASTAAPTESAAPGVAASTAVPAVAELIAAAPVDAVKVLADQLSASQVKVGELMAALATANENVKTVTAQLPDFHRIVRASIGTMQVALGSADSSKAVADASLVSEHARLVAAFQDKFPAARVSAAVSDTSEPTGAATPHPAFAQRLNQLAAIRSGSR